MTSHTTYPTVLPTTQVLQLPRSQSGSLPYKEATSGLGPRQLTRSSKSPMDFDMAMDHVSLREQFAVAHDQVTAGQSENDAARVLKAKQNKFLVKAAKKTDQLVPEVPKIQGTGLVSCHHSSEQTGESSTSDKIDRSIEEKSSRPDQEECIEEEQEAGKPHERKYVNVAHCRMLLKPRPRCPRLTRSVEELKAGGDLEEHGLEIRRPRSGCSTWEEAIGAG